jgi:cytochrome c peroxidase
LKTRVAAGIQPPDGNNPVNNNAGSIFAADAFNVNFFTPGNAYAVTPARINLGKKLFSDSILSGYNNRSCASCHRPEKAFTDGLKTPFALDGESLLLRNTPTLLNSALQSRQFSDSRTDILENQLDEVVHNEKEMSGSLKNSALRLKSSPVYTKLFGDAYADIKDPVTPFTIANAISSYIRSLVTLNSRFDQYMRGNKTALSVSEKNGFNLFAGKAKCATCHFIPLFNGLVPPVFTETESEILGVPATKNKNPAVLDADPGKFNFTKSVIHKYAFKTPTLRNIELTAPYMHNGVYTTLEEVMDFYNNGGGKGLKIAPPNQSLPFDRLQLSKREIADVIQFMKSLTDTSYLIKPAG